MLKDIVKTEENAAEPDRIKCFNDQMALYEKCNTEGLIDKYLSRTLIYVDGDEIPIFYDFIINNPHINRDKLYSDKERTVGELKFIFSGLIRPTVLTTRENIQMPDAVIENPQYFAEFLSEYSRSLDIAEKTYEKGNLSDKYRIGIFFNSRTGDAYYTFAMNEVYEKCSGKKPVYIFREYCKGVFDLFSDYNLECVTLTDDEYNLLYKTSRIMRGEYFLKYNILDYLNYGEFHRTFPEMGLYKGLCYSLHIPYDESNKRLLIRPAGQTCDRDMYIERDGIIPGRTVLLCPESYSDPMLSYEFWNKLQFILEDMGCKCLVMAYMIYTKLNMKGPFVKIPYSDVIDYVHVCGYVVAKRSGFTDVISSAKTSLTIVNSDKYFSEAMDLITMGLRQESDGFFNNIHVDETRMNEDGYASEILSAVLKFTE
jgi:hypothetical protein